MLTCLVRLNMGAGLVGQLCLAARREEGVLRPSTGSNRSRLNTGKPSYLMKNMQTHISDSRHTFALPVSAKKTSKFWQYPI